MAIIFDKLKKWRGSRVEGKCMDCDCPIPVGPGFCLSCQECYHDPCHPDWCDCHLKIGEGEWEELICK